mmetsp:Transcript_19646/g.59546  ORF Transcript_19646/g.59546 Transcript_19646/m.59546 type:complete len:463 (-) Transcript_19646:2780-4168(-)|eukprot:scaffold38990_cov26-Tisochrysis_lutea.AAC.10
MGGAVALPSSALSEAPTVLAIAVATGAAPVATTGTAVATMAPVASEGVVAAVTAMPQLMLSVGGSLETGDPVSSSKRARRPFGRERAVVHRSTMDRSSIRRRRNNRFACAATADSPGSFRMPSTRAVRMDRDSLTEVAHSGRSIRYRDSRCGCTSPPSHGSSVHTLLDVGGEVEANPRLDELTAVAVHMAAAARMKGVHVRKAASASVIGVTGGPYAARRGDNGGDGRPPLIGGGAAATIGGGGWCASTMSAMASRSAAEPSGESEVPSVDASKHPMDLERAIAHGISAPAVARATSPGAELASVTVADGACPSSTVSFQPGISSLRRRTTSSTSVALSTISSHHPALAPRTEEHAPITNEGRMTRAPMREQSSRIVTAALVSPITAAPAMGAVGAKNASPAAPSVATHGAASSLLSPWPRRKSARMAPRRKFHKGAACFQSAATRSTPRISRAERKDVVWP